MGIATEKKPSKYGRFFITLPVLILKSGYGHEDLFVPFT